MTSSDVQWARDKNVHMQLMIEKQSTTFCYGLSDQLAYIGEAE